MQSTFLIEFKDLGKPDNHVQCERNGIEVE